MLNYTQFVLLGTQIDLIHSTPEPELQNLLNLGIDGFRCGGGCPPIDYHAFLVDKEFLEIPLTARKTPIKFKHNNEKHIYLDSLQTKKSGLLILEPFENLIRVVPVYVGFLHQGKSHSVIESAKLPDRSIITGLLTTKLCATRPSEDK